MYPSRLREFTGDITFGRRGELAIVQARRTMLHCKRATNQSANKVVSRYVCGSLTGLYFALLVFGFLAEIHKRAMLERL